MKRLVCGVGDCDVFTGGCGSNRYRSYQLWKDMIRRCYGDIASNSVRSYKGCEVSPDWMKYSAFKKDVEDMFGFYEDDYQMDKDLLGNGKLYSKTTCCFLPRKINMFLVKHENRRGNLPIGVSLCNNRLKPYRVRGLNIDGNNVEIGRYSSVSEAFEAYKVFKKMRAEEFLSIYSEKLDERVVVALREYELKIDD